MCVEQGERKQATYQTELKQNDQKQHCVKSVRIRNFSGPYLSVLEVSTVFFSNTGKYRSEKTPNRGTFHALQTYTHIPVPKNLQHESQGLTTENKKVPKNMKENGIKNNIAIKAAFLRYGISKARERLNVDEQCYPYISLLCYRQTLTVIFTFFSCTTQYTFQCVFSHYFTCFPLFLIDQYGVRQRTYSIYQSEMQLFNFEIRILEFEATILECNNSEKLLQLNLRQ